MSNWEQLRPQVVANKHHQVRHLIRRWKEDLPSRHSRILHSGNDFVQLLYQLLRSGYSVIEVRRTKVKGARWHEPVGTEHIKSKVDRLGVIPSKYVRHVDPFQRGTHIRTRSGKRPVTIYDRKKGGPNLAAMRALLENPLG